MALREPYAVGWYPPDNRNCAGTIEMYLRGLDIPDLPNPLQGGLVPHAGWPYSGRCAALTIAALARNAPPPEVVVVLGAVHSLRVSRPTVCSYEGWKTPVGELYVERHLRQALMDDRVVDVNDDAHTYEHSIEVHTPLLRYIIPDAQFVPISVPPDASALAFGDHLARIIAADGRRIAVLASSDLTHYGEAYNYSPGGKGAEGMDWAQANDEALLENVTQLDAEGVLEHALRKQSACGSGALAAAMTAARAMGATRGQVLERTSSHEQRPHGDMWVGYASAVFRR